MAAVRAAFSFSKAILSRDAPAERNVLDFTKSGL
jgi:hypothetical protein